ncbi:hypothetical protein CMI45_00410 [Candidatus Pacearchaeota archaeon]|nr:hypothetical protein [Candidatus Pacearchaeota archaeon]|tara:strand:- start:1305 stop:2072 length:768 start_codon:yes stop_codon:yes gene_type:complete
MERLREMQKELNYTRVLYKERKFIFRFTIVFLVLGIILTLMTPKVYESDSLIELGSFSKDLKSNILVAGEIERDHVYTQAEAKNIISSSIILNPVIEEYFSKGYSLNEFRKNNIEVIIVSERGGLSETLKTSFVNIRTKANSPEIARDINAKTVSNFLSFAEVRYQSKIDTISNKIDRLNRDLIGIGAERQIDLKEEKRDLQEILDDARSFKVISDPQLPKEASEPSLLTNVLLALILGVVIGSFVAVFREMLNR